MQQLARQYPCISGFFDFHELNPVQKQCIHPIMDTEDNLIVSAPTSSGKTVLFELALLKYAHLSSPLCLYLAPIKSLCHEKYTHWTRKFKNRLRVLEVTGDSVDTGIDQVYSSHIAIGTPEKIDYLSRQSLEYLKRIKLLLIDEIHMLNFEQRGATLEAVVSRVMSLNSEVRIIAVSASIPNIEEVGQWLRVPPQSIGVFGQEYRPVAINKVVLGFKSTGNPFTFEKSLNYKLLDCVRHYSEDKGSLVFCPTQKGTQSACEQIISQMRERQFIENDRQLMSLIQAAKQVSNKSLQNLLPQGVAFHNASLSPQDRTVVQDLFLNLKVKVLCTTSTLAMGINLPARLVIIKSTQCYRGAMKGYQEYSRIEMDQMSGRAGRPPFDTQGTVVIMTEKHNYNRYNGSLALQPLQSQLFANLLEHLNAEISLGSILTLSDVEEYLRNSFCYIRMKKCPKAYGITGNVDQFVRSECLKAVEHLKDLKAVNFSTPSNRIHPRPLSHSISRSAVEIASIELLTKASKEITSEREYLTMVCKCSDICKYHSKVEERKTLKALNQGNKFVLKEAISNPQRKAFVLIQTELSKKTIDFWELRRQASDMVLMFKRLNYCCKSLGKEINHFWMSYWATRYQRYLQERFWETADTQALLQLTPLTDKVKLLNAKGIKSIADLRANLPTLSKWIPQVNQASLIKEEFQAYSRKTELFVQEKPNSSAWTLKVCFEGQFIGKFKGISICIGDNKDSLYDIRYISDSKREIFIDFPRAQRNQFKIGVIKDSIIGFDEFYLMTGKEIQPFNIDQIGLKPPPKARKSAQPRNNDRWQSLTNKRSNSAQVSNVSKVKKEEKSPSHVSSFKPGFNRKTEVKESSFSEIRDQMNQRYTEKQQKHERIPQNFRFRESVMAEPISMSDEEIGQKQILPIRESTHKGKTLKDYKWKPGFEQFSDDGSQEEQTPKPKKVLKIVESKEKPQPKKRWSAMIRREGEVEQEREKVDKKKQEKQEVQNAYEYFLNLF